LSIIHRKLVAKKILKMQDIPVGKLSNVRQFNEVIQQHFCNLNIGYNCPTKRLMILYQNAIQEARIDVERNERTNYFDRWLNLLPYRDINNLALYIASRQTQLERTEFHRLLRLMDHYTYTYNSRLYIDESIEIHVHMSCIVPGYIFRGLENHPRYGINGITQQPKIISIQMQQVINLSDDMGECPICLESLPEKDLLNTNCNHKVCYACTSHLLLNCKQQLKGEVACPLCRTTINALEFSEDGHFEFIKKTLRNSNIPINTIEFV
jgi:hypothetical protein